jgi:Kelch motif
MKLWIKYIGIVVAVILSGLHCAGTGDEVVTGTRISASIFEQDGKRLAAGVDVKIFKSDAVNGRPVLEQKTSENGTYYFAELPPGRYNIWAQRDSQACFQSDIIIGTTDPLIPDDTLDCISSITGTVIVEPQHDPRSVTIRAVGLDKFITNTGSDGRFTLSEMAKGTYTLLLESTIEGYTPTVRKVDVRSCSKDTLTDTLRCVFTGIPVVNGLHTSFDTISGIVRLAWAPTNYRNLQNFVIFRDKFDTATYSSIPLASINDTVFYDTIFKTGSPSGRFSAADTNNYHFRYRVAIRDNMCTIGPTFRYTDAVAVSPVKVRTFITFTARQVAKNITFTPFHDIPAYGNSLLTGTASVNDTVAVYVLCNNATRTLRSLSWRTVSPDCIPRIQSLQSLKTITDSVRYAWSSTGLKQIIFTVCDNAGLTTTDTARITIVDDAPQLKLSVSDSGLVPDTVTQRYQLAFGDTIALHFDAIDRFGSINNVRWRFGTLTCSPSLSNNRDTVMIAPDSAVSHLPVSVHVWDDDGNKSSDTLDISVGPFGLVTPKASFVPRMYQSAIAFAGKMWIFGGVGIVQETPYSTSVKSLTDVWNSSDGRTWTKVSSNVPARSGHAMVEFNGRLWLFGGYSGSWGTCKNDVWSSADGITWTCVTDSASFSPRIYHSASVFAGRMFVIGGRTGTSHANDIWSSVDGVTWEKSSDSISFSARCGHSSMVFKNKLWIIGGLDDSYLPLNDAWCSSDGTKWTLVTDQAEFSPRQGHSGIVWANKIWIIGGCGFGSSDLSGDIWYSDDGTNWKESIGSQGCSVRTFHSSLTFKDRIWVIAGQSGSRVLAGDIWRSGIYLK